MPIATSTDEDVKRARFGAAVKLAREANDLGPAEFAKQMGITPRWLNNIEAGRTPASNRLYLRIAKALDMDASDVVRSQS